MWHRKARKTSTVINEIYKQAHLRVGVYWHLFPTYREAKDTVWRDPNMIFSILDERLIKKKNETDLIIEFKNGSIYQLLGADDPDRLRGPNPFGIALDEYDTMKEDVWSTVQPVLAANGGWAWFLGTPKGKLKLFNLYQLGQTGDKEWKSWRLKASESGIIAKEELENARKTMSQALFNQEFETEFLEGEGSVFRNVRRVCTAEPKEPIPGHLYVMGVDLAKVQDYTVLAVYDRSTNAQVYQDRFNTLEWGFVKKRIKAASDFYNKALAVVDATGLGDPIADDLIRAGVPVITYKITNESKKEMIEKLSIWIEQAKIKMLPIEDTFFEFDNFSYEISSSGRVVYQAREGFHDDIIISHALAVSELYDIPKEKIIVEQPLIRQEFIKRLKTHNPYELSNEYEEI